MILHLEDLETASCGGRIWLDIDGTCFPEEGWYDLPGTLLKYWVPALRSFASGHSDFSKLGFLDGPYAVWLTREQDAVTVTCLEQGRAVLEQQIDFPLFWESVERQLRHYERVKYLALEE